jgi:hypothetical protein
MLSVTFKCYAECRSPNGRTQGANIIKLFTVVIYEWDKYTMEFGIAMSLSFFGVNLLTLLFKLDRFMTMHNFSW